MTTLEIDAPQLHAAHLVERPGTLPSVTFPMTRTTAPDVEGVWRYLSEPAEFFGIRMPGLADLTAAMAVFVEDCAAAGSAVIAATVTIAESDEAPQILLTGSAVRPLRTDAVRIGGGDGLRPLHRATDARWRRMAARTTSKGEADQCERWLNARGFADGLSDGVPLLGAIVFETDHGVVGVENGEPTSVLHQLAACGVITEVERVSRCPAHPRYAWWLSPRYQTHPVADIDGTQVPVCADVAPPFARWS